MAYTFHPIENELKIDGFYTFFSRKYPQNYVTQVETKIFWEIVYIKEGTIILVVDDERYTLNSGDMFFIKPMANQTIISIGDSNLLLYALSFSATGYFLDFLENKFFTLNEEQKQEYEGLFSYLLEFCPKDTTDNMFSLFDDCKVTPTILHILRNMVEVFLLKNISNIRLMQYDNPYLLPKVVVKAIIIMRENCNLALSVDEIAKMAHTSSATLKKLFQKYMKTGIHEYYLNIKIAQARILLGAGNSVTATAEKLAFKSQSYFSTVYKRITGSPPANDATYR